MYVRGANYKVGLLPKSSCIFDNDSSSFVSFRLWPVWAIDYENKRSSRRRLHRWSGCLQGAHTKCRWCWCNWGNLIIFMWDSFMWDAYSILLHPSEIGPWAHFSPCGSPMCTNVYKNLYALDLGVIEKYSMKNNRVCPIFWISPIDAYVKLWSSELSWNSIGVYGSPLK